MANAFTDLTVARRIEKLKADLAASAAATAKADTGQAFLSKLTMRSGDIAVGVAADSTWNASDEAIDLYMTKLAADNPTLAVEIKHWNDTTQAYSAATVVSAGIAETGGTVFQDTFTRTAAEIYGTTPDIGEVWGRDGTNAMGDWSLNGTQAVRSADTTNGGILATGAAGDTETTVDMNLSSLGTGTSRTFRLYFCYLNSTNHAFLQISIGTTGTVTWNITSRVNNVATAVATGTSNPFPANTTGSPVTLKGKLQGTTLSGSINGTTISGTLSSADAAVLASGVQAGVSGGIAGDAMNSFQIVVLAPAPPKKLTLWNASMSGSTLLYQQTRFAPMFPVPLDLLIINSGHNYGTNTPAQYEAAIDSFIAAFRAVQPAAGIVISSQNPQKAPASGRVSHLLRQATLKSYAARKGIGYIPGMEAFKALPDGGVTLIATDGVHPTPGASNSGSSLWRDAITNYFAALASTVGPAGPAGPAGSAGSAGVAGAQGPAGAGVAMPNIPGHWALLNPGPISARTDFMVGYFYVMPVVIPTAMDITALTFQVTTAAPGASMAVGVYNQPSAGQFNRMLNFGSIDCSTNGEKQMSGTVTLPAGIVYFGWVQLGAQFSTATTNGPIVVPGPHPIGQYNSNIEASYYGWLVGSGFINATANFNTTSGMNSTVPNLRIGVKLA
jgi:hypothetical protein